MTRTIPSLFIIIFVITTALPTTAQNNPVSAAYRAISGWVEAPSSRTNPALWECARHGGSWTVSLQQGAISVNELDSHETPEGVPLPSYLKLSEEMVGRRSLLRTADGWLIGFDLGEFGGGLWWFNNDGSVVKKLSSWSVRSILEASRGTFVLTGVGEIDQFIETPDDVSLKYVADLEDRPEASTVDRDGQIVVVTMNNVLRVDYFGKVHKICTFGEHSTFPTSVEVDGNGDIVVAMRFFGVRLVAGEREYPQQWLMQTKCKSFKTAKNICTCTGSD